MGFLRNEEVRRLLKHLRDRIDDRGRLAQIEDELSGEFAEEFIREPELLAFFPELSDEFVVSDARWKLRVIPHGHLRLVQRGMKLPDISGMFRRFLETYAAASEVITVGGYIISGRLKARAARITLRIDVDSVTDEFGLCHLVTIYVGRGDSGNMTRIDLN
jgi:hypothetical protein